MNFTYTEQKSSMCNHKTSFPKRNNNLEEIYSSHYTSNKNGSSQKVKLIDPLARDDFQRTFYKLNSYKCFSKGKKSNTTKSLLKINEKRHVPKKKLGFALSTRSFELTLKKKQLFYKGRIFPKNSKNLCIQNCKI
jgi:hypothetical protein